MNILQFLNGKKREKKEILSHLAKFLTTDNSHLEQINKENKESTDLEENENNKDIFSYIYGHDKLKTIFRNAIESEEPIHILLTGSSGTAKSLFLESISDNVKQSYMITNVFDYYKKDYDL